MKNQHIQKKIDNNQLGVFFLYFGGVNLQFIRDSAMARLLSPRCQSRIELRSCGS